MVNGGPSQHANSPYYPLPFSNALVAGISDSGYQHPQLLPKFTLADGSELIPTAFIKNIQTKGSDKNDKQFVVSYQQDALTLLGKNRPVKDSRISLKTKYLFEPGKITRVDEYTAQAPVEVADLSLSFASFSNDAAVQGNRVTFRSGGVTKFSVDGIDQCTARDTNGAHEFKSPTGPMRTHVLCKKTNFTFNQALTIRWEIHYQ
jgi:hypothetical protein